MSESATPALRFKGQDQNLGGTTYVVPPLALGAVKELLPRIQKMKSMDGVPSSDDIDTMIDVLGAAIRRNYPDVTSAMLLDLIDLGNVKPIFRMIMGMSGLVEDASGNSAAAAASP